MLFTAASYHNYPGCHLESFDMKMKRKIVKCEKKKKGWFKKRRNGGSLSIDNGLCSSGGVTPSLGNAGSLLIIFLKADWLTSFAGCWCICI